jgi:N-acetylglutamate synthase-like GNAT family acetyltransferase
VVTVQIRVARPGDARAVAELVQQAYDHYVPRIGARPRPMDEDYPALIAAGQVWVAVDSGVVGVIVLDHQGDHLQIDNVAVMPERQGSGVGTALLDFAEDRARALGVPELRLFTHALMTENQAYYTRRGYVQTARTLDDGFDRVFFAKRLAD